MRSDIADCLKKLQAALSMKIGILVIASLQALTRNKLRTMLTMLGVIIGISYFITITGMSRSANIIVESRVYSYGVNAMSVQTIKKTILQQRLR